MTTHYRSTYRHSKKNKATYAKFFVAVALLAGIIWLLYFGLQYFSFGSNQVSGAFLHTDTPEQVSILIDGEWKQNVNEIKVYENNTIKTNNGYAKLEFTNQDVIYIDQNSLVEIVQNSRSDTNQTVSITLSEGAIYIKSAKQTLETSRIIQTELGTITIPNETEAILTTHSVSVYNDNSAGTEVFTPIMTTPLIIGEGQMLVKPETGFTTDNSNNYTFRTSLQTNNETKQALLQFIQASSGTQNPTGSSATITLIKPTENETITSTSVTISGTVAGNIHTLTVNDLPTDIRNNAFEKNVSVDANTKSIIVKGYDVNKVEVQSVERAIRIDLTAPSAPVVTSPEFTNGTYSTTKDSIKITGTVEKNTQKITVNDYDLQLFQANTTRFQYLAETALGNLKNGENVYTITTTNSAGIKSAPLVLTVIKNSLQSSSVSTSTTSSVASILNSIGSIVITGPTSKSTYETSDAETLLEGTTTGNTDSVWVNDYKLQLFEPAKGIWNYKASEQLGTMKVGDNTYTIIAKDAAGKTLDTKKITITYKKS